ncbi:putative membrane protein (DUF2177) [Paramecium bursaria Chlorella virus CviKI]|nr:putative membrane protein (DUF2177) [Paramecium bursaria Chlorella virus CviKI]
MTGEVIKIVKLSAILLILDLIWIRAVSGKLFTQMIETIQGSPLKIKMAGALAAYVAIIALFYMFVSETTTNFKAFLLGFLAYAIYDFTNYALISEWDFKTSILDALWGGTLFFLTKKIMYG